MSDEKEKKPEKKAEEAKPPSKLKGRLLGVVGLLAVVGVSSVASAVLSPLVAARVAPAPSAAAAKPPPKSHAKAAEEEEEDDDEEGEEGEKKGPKALLSLEAVVVDLRDQAGDTHHMKVGVAFELKKELPEEEGKIFVSRARDAAITYLRTLSYEDVTDHAKFEAIRKELSTRVIKGFGRKHSKKMLITEYVVQ